MPDLNDKHEKDCVANLVDDAIIADADAIEVIAALEFDAAGRPRISFQSAHCIDQAPLELFVAETLDEFRRSGSDDDTITHRSSRCSNSSSVTASPVFS
jgi:hypothetical protein